MSSESDQKLQITPKETMETAMAVNVASWNIAAVNNNPFEYWITSPDPALYLL
jgi:hypothetical protein